MDPADLFLPSARTEHLGAPGLEDGQIDHLSHGKRHLHSVKNARVSLTLCPQSVALPDPTLRHMADTITHWIDNKPFAGGSGATAPVTNPATGAVTGQVALATVQDA